MTKKEIEKQFIKNQKKIDNKKTDKETRKQLINKNDDLLALYNAINYYEEQQKENEKNGDTIKRRDLIFKMIEQVKNIKSMILKDKTPQEIKDLYNDYFNDLIFTPCKEDLQEMKYWI